jgi:hypothetical protein
VRLTNTNCDDIASVVKGSTYHMVSSRMHTATDAPAPHAPPSALTLPPSTHVPVHTRAGFPLVDFLWRKVGTARAVNPEWGDVRPFALLSSSQFRPPAPPGRKARVYKRDYDEGKAPSSRGVLEAFGCFPLWPVATAVSHCAMVTPLKRAVRALASMQLLKTRTTRPRPPPARPCVHAFVHAVWTLCADRHCVPGQSY